MAADLRFRQLPSSPPHFVYQATPGGVLQYEVVELRAALDRTAIAEAPDNMVALAESTQNLKLVPESGGFREVAGLDGHERGQIGEVLLGYGEVDGSEASAANLVASDPLHGRGTLPKLEAFLSSSLFLQFFSVWGSVLRFGG